MRPEKRIPALHTALLCICSSALAVWIYLIAFRGGFWRVSFGRAPVSFGSSKSVCVVIPARDEEATIGQAVASLRPWPVIVVDDHSSDRTAELARAAGAEVIAAAPLPPGWSGKLWALSQGLDHAASRKPDYFLLTDADIVHSPTNVGELVARAEDQNLDLASLMVKLRCRSTAEKLLIPAFVFFFFMLYPPAWVARRNRRTAAAAGGCILIRPTALARIGGIAAIKHEIIDDCALARAVKRSGGNIWMGLTPDTESIRDYTSFAEIRAMISRTAFAQLQHSALLLAGTIVSMAILYLAPPVFALIGNPIAIAAWMLMSLSYIPMLRFYGRSPALAPLLPLIALFYMFATFESAIAYWTGRGGAWKGRHQDT